ncbi:hypothetical protein [Falsihalocynthiibacter arcticus]|uniref:Uncharacterized protein n=1 Tax=Falsihalocynthiibacter arcticus TaxID=1579316 RepID=A0A126V4Z1_9RHOB|nr:hypothetical protein [Falsihalocynthiibacter arcticus]AML53384.1 hypothetical protein RC74_20890 [Falsihalocynthiibacter arcticus]
MNRIIYIFATAFALIGMAEIFYFFFWGDYLFPGVSLAAKAVWVASCGIAMGAVIGAVTLLLVEGRTSGRAAILAGAAIVTTVGSYCAWLCSRVDAKFEYFGGPENGTLFILSGVIPAIAGGLLYGWWLYGREQGIGHTL